MAVVGTRFVPLLLLGSGCSLVNRGVYLLRGLVHWRRRQGQARLVTFANSQRHQRESENQDGGGNGDMAWARRHI